ncbi:MAG TPA: VWA domain-containing protein [bacterium]|nr:VWA domain-containing protein [bacterium]HQG44265.1 VWA domain-containing protein [bacterium]HQI49443.1 VWA domain-containing protein [bacterium]HQJ63503.1 VWA domain-containing protein [bacterium]
MKITRALLLLALILLAVIVFCPRKAVSAEKPQVQLALLLDTSNSMDGLIDQARTQLWKIVNEFISARVDGQRPEIAVALYHYGTPSLGERTGYIRQLSPLTNDLDKISEALFSLTTNGGDEYCGAVIGRAVDELAWSSGKQDYRAIFIAGNEPFTQGDVDFRTTCKKAITKGILVNTIFCGSRQEGIDTQWQAGADLADGSYFNIDQNAKSFEPPTPFDQELADLGTGLNRTYIAYGREGAVGAANQACQDINAAMASPVAVVQRAITKSQAIYSNAGWDLVDAVQQKQVRLEELEKEDLPEEMRSMTPAERQKYLDRKFAERKAIQEKIEVLRVKRAAYISEEEKKSAAGGEVNTLDKAMSKVLRSQAQKANFTF